MCFSFKADIHPDELKEIANAQTAAKSFELFYKENPEGLGTTIFPNAYALGMVKMKQGNVIVPMRYRVRPHASKEEVPAKYNLYNARIEGLLTKDTWKPLVGRKHVSIPMNAFNEWVSTEQGKKIVQFSIKEKNLFWVAGLFDIWENPETKDKLISFALVTRPPTKYIEEVGHDRCPAIMTTEQAISWVGDQKDEQESLSFLHKLPEVLDFTHQFAVI